MAPSTALLVLRLVDLLAMGVQLAPEIRARFDDASARVKRMVEEGRDPTPEEWAEIDAETDASIAAITGN